MGKQQRKQASVKQPVSRHPLFPAVVAVWFGALFGMGSLAVRASLLEAIVINTRIDAVVAAAAPPLGMTARILLALGMAAVGGVIGAVVARRIAKPRPEKRERTRNAAAESAKEVVAPVYVDNPTFTPSGRRRALAVEEDYEPEYPRDAAPLPGGAPQILDVTQIDLAEPVATAAVVSGPENDELDLAGFTAPPQVAEPVIELAPVSPAPRLDRLPTLAGESDDVAQPLFQTPAPIMQTVETAPAPALAVSDAIISPVAAMAPQPVVSAPTASQMFNSNASAVPINFDQSPSPRVAPEVTTETPVAAAPVMTIEAPAAASPVETPRLRLPEGKAALRIATAPLADLSPVELIERLALSLQARRNVPSAEPAKPVVAEAMESLSPASMFPGTSFLAAVQTQAPQPPFAGVPENPVPAPTAVPRAFDDVPAALRPIAFDELIEDGDDSALLLPTRTFAASETTLAATPEAPAVDLPLAPSATASLPLQPVSPFAAAVASEAQPDDGDDADEEMQEDSYSSLLDLNRPMPRGFVRIDDSELDDTEIEPVVIFPGHGVPMGSRFSAPPEAAPAGPIAAVTEAPAASVAAPSPAVVAATSAPALRRFDAPDQSAEAAPVPANPVAPPAPTIDPAATEQALRSALATLQRMSGAA